MAQLHPSATRGSQRTTTSRNRAAGHLVAATRYSGQQEEAEETGAVAKVTALKNRGCNGLPRVLSREEEGLEGLQDTLPVLPGSALELEHPEGTQSM